MSIFDVPLNEIKKPLQQLEAVVSGGGTIYPDALFASVKAAKDFFGSDVATLSITTPDFPSGVTHTVPQTMRIEFSGAGSISRQASQTLTILSDSRSWPIRQIFTGSGSQSFTGNQVISMVYSEWWGIPSGTADCYPAIQAAQNAVEQIKSAILMFSARDYYVDTAILISNVKGIRWLGCGPDFTRIIASNGNSAVQTNGCWRSKFEGIFFLTDATITDKGVFELDGGFSGGFGVQGNVFERCYFSAEDLAPYAFTMVRQGGSGGQGSENLFLNCNFDKATWAGYHQEGFNALQNTFIGGNCQGNHHWGLGIVVGSANVYSMGFQSTIGYDQIVNDGWDIYAAGGGVNDRIIVDGCRTESLRFYKGGSSQYGIIRGLNQTISNPGWAATTAYVLKQIVVKTSPSGVRKVYRVTTAGTSGGAEPTWPNSGTVADGSVVWTQTDFNAIDMTAGEVEGSYVQAGDVSFRVGSIVATNTNFTGSGLERQIVVDCTSGNRTITLRNADYVSGQEVIIKKLDDSANTATVTAPGNAIDLNADYVIPGGSRGWVRLLSYTAGIVGSAWYVTGRSVPSSTIPVISDAAYDATTWNGNTDGATKNAIRDIIEALAAATQPLDSDLTAIAALSTTSYGRGLLALADAAALRTAGGLVIGTDVQPLQSLGSYLWNSWNPPDLVGTYANASSSGTADVDAAFYTTANSSGTLTFTFVKAGRYQISFIMKATHAAAYTYDNGIATYGGTASNTSQAGFDQWGEQDIDGNWTTTDTFLVVATAGQTLTVLPKYRVSGVGTTANHNAYARVNVSGPM